MEKTMKPLVFSLSILASALLSSGLSAKEPAKRPGGERGPAARGQNTRPGERDPAAMVARMIKEFDKDADNKLDSAELTALLASMRERRAAGPAGREAGQSRRRAGEGGPDSRRPGAGERRRSAAENGEDAGGKRPQRPNQE